MPVVIIMSWLSCTALPRALLSDLVLTGIQHEMGITNTIMSRRENGCRRLNDTLPATQMENSRLLLPLSSSGGAVLSTLTIPPAPISPPDILFKCNCFSFGSILLFTNNNQSSERYSSMKEQKLLKLLSHWFYKVSRANIKNWIMSKENKHTKTVLRKVETAIRK